MELKMIESPEQIPGDIKMKLGGRRLLLLTDSGVARHCLPLIKPMFGPIPVCIIPRGESNKTLATCEKVWQFLVRHKADRQSVLIILGGGMPGDLGAFCASTYLRGISYVLVPTTLLAMVDASIGGKTGIDFLHGKNLLGSFSSPEMVITCPEFLTNLPEKELVSGAAEVVKHWLISDQNQWQSNRKTDLKNLNWSKIIPENQAIKQAIVSADFRESGKRKSLNAGHTVGHAIESLFLARKRPIAHGLAIAAGLLIECHISFQKGRLSDRELGEIEEYIFSCFGRLILKPGDEQDLWKWMQLDKKNKSGKVMTALIGPIGNCEADIVINRAEWKKAFTYYLGK